MSRSLASVTTNMHTLQDVVALKGGLSFVLNVSMKVRVPASITPNVTEGMSVDLPRYAPKSFHGMPP